MVADPGPGVPIPTLTWGYVVAAVAFPVRAGSPRFSRVSGWHRLQAAHGGSLCQIRAKVLGRERRRRARPGDLYQPPHAAGALRRRLELFRAGQVRKIQVLP